MKIRTGFLAVVVATVVALLAVVSPAGADTSSALNNNAYGATDGRGDVPSHPGTMARWRYGRYTVPGGSPYGQIHNPILTVQAPCTNCRITDMVPDLIDANTGQSVNIADGLMLHHFVLINPGATRAPCLPPPPEQLRPALLRLRQRADPPAPAAGSAVVRLHQRQRQLDVDHPHRQLQNATPRDVDVRSITAGGPGPRRHRQFPPGWTSTAAATCSPRHHGEFRILDPGPSAT